MNSASFPLAEQFGRAAIRGVGGTRHCDWWFTNDAVLIDTAGRYTTHEGNRALDEAEWKGFVDLLKKYRTRQPLNGAMLTISVADLLGASEAERTQHAMVLRKRLLELRAQLGIRFPVYLLVTKADLLAGFAEYFSHYGRAECAQVWGFTFPLAQSEAPGFDLRAAFDREYRLLHQRLNDRLPELLAAQTDARQREMTYLLPQQIADLQDMLGQFVAEVFSVSSYEPMPMLRGVYLTSGTQGGHRVRSRDERHQALPEDRGRAAGRAGRFDRAQLLPEVAAAGAHLPRSRARRQRPALAPEAARAADRRLRAARAGVRGRAVCVAAQLFEQPRVSRPDRRARAGRRCADRRREILRCGRRRAPAAVLDALGNLANAGGVDLQHPPLAYRWGLFQARRSTKPSTPCTGARSKTCC